MKTWGSPIIVVKIYPLSTYIKLMASETEETDLNDLFVEPENYYQEDKPPTFVTHKLRSGEELELRLVGQNPLWVCKTFFIGFQC